MSCKLLIVANLAKLRPVIRRTTSRTSNCRANGLRTNRSSAVGRAAAHRTPARARNARGQQPMTRWPGRSGGTGHRRHFPRLRRGASTALSPASPPVRGDPSAPVPVGEGSLSERTWCPPRQPPPAASPGRCGRPLGVVAAACWCKGRAAPAVYAWGDRADLRNLSRDSGTRRVRCQHSRRS